MDLHIVRSVYRDRGYDQTSETFFTLDDLIKILETVHKLPQTWTDIKLKGPYSPFLTTRASLLVWCEAIQRIYYVATGETLVISLAEKEYLTLSVKVRRGNESDENEYPTSLVMERIIRAHAQVTPEEMFLRATRALSRNPRCPGRLYTMVDTIKQNYARGEYEYPTLVDVYKELKELEGLGVC